jgi:glycerophosphoryl diester phosphodiesterase
MGIVIHDETLDRTTNGKGAVNQYTIPELKRLKNKWTTNDSDINGSLWFNWWKMWGQYRTKSFESAAVVTLIEKYVHEKNGITVNL